MADTAATATPDATPISDATTVFIHPHLATRAPTASYPGLTNRARPVAWPDRLESPPPPEVAAAGAPTVEVKKANSALGVRRVRQACAVRQRLPDHAAQPRGRA